ncbi:MAG TPA: glycosyl hydrolase family 65 protein [Bryobacteraceae bacterium]|nr:glycosyl hydrolase family 65 protein [Bryobacteraceae bacterium]
MKRRTFLGVSAGALAALESRAISATAPAVLDAGRFRHYIEEFNQTFTEEVVNFIPDADAWEFLSANIPFFTCPDAEIERLYYYRWWTFRKHIKQTPAGFLITEFLKPVKHAGEYNALSCALGHHIAEGRWLRDPRYVDGDLDFWLRSGAGHGIRANLHQFSGWVASAMYDRWLSDARTSFATAHLDALIEDYSAWERERLTDSGLFWQRDVSDGMESSISGGRKVQNIRPSINSYMYGNAKAIAAIAEMADNNSAASAYRDKAARLRELTLQRLWNHEAAFFETLDESSAFATVRENIGYTPWYFDLPETTAEFGAPWKQLLDSRGFNAPFGPTTAERRHPDFQIAYKGDDCQWNGPSWPFATTITLRALGNYLRRASQPAVSVDDYFETFHTYTRSQRLTLDNGRNVPFIDENLNPLTGEWLARAMKIQKKTFYGRGDHYNHSGYADLVITGLSGLVPRADSTVEVHPLLPANRWDWFCLDRIPYHGRNLTIIWDKNGSNFGRGKGLRVLADGKEIAHAPGLTRITGPLA